MQKTKLTQEIYDICTRLLKQELQVAMGCTEPIALAFCAAYATKLLGKMPTRIHVACSGNVIKNVKAVTVPKTGGLKGIEAAVLAGAVVGKPELELELLNAMTEGDQTVLQKELSQNKVSVSALETTHALHAVLEAYAGDDCASVEIIDAHTQLGQVVHNGKVLHTREEKKQGEDKAEREKLSIAAILEYADTVDLDDARDVLEKQIKYNSVISSEGLSGYWGECVGRTLSDMNHSGIYTHIKAATAAGSDARMNGCPLPVVVNSGSGNQGMAASLPVIEYARITGADDEKLLRALCVSNLVTIHQKTEIGRLSAYCGVVCAATGSAAAIAYMNGGNYQCISDTITNSICNAGGMVCDGAKSSCAAKISTALDSALLGYEMARTGRVFREGEGLVQGDVEATIAGVGRMASKGMAAADREILHIMIGRKE